MAVEHIPTWGAADTAFKARFQQLLATGQARRAFIFWDLLPASIPVIYLAFLLPPSTPNRLAIQIALYAVICSLSLESFLNVRSDHYAFNYGLGLEPIYLLVWSGITLFLQDPASTFQRLQYNRASSKRSDEEKKKTALNGHAVSSPPSDKQGDDGDAERPGPVLHWQGYPETWPHRLTWFTDLILNFRYIGWREQAPYLGFKARDVEDSIAKAERAAPGNPPIVIVGRSGNRTFFQRGPCLQAKLISLLTSYLILDFGTWFTRRDPYFWALDFAPSHLRSSGTMPPPSYLPPMLAHSTFYLQAYRILLSSAMIIAALNAFLMVPPIVCLLLSYLPSSFSANTTVTAPWRWPDEFGSLTAVMAYGLAGGWGGWWHQTFRNMFSAPSEAIFRRTGINRKGLAGRLVQAAFAFTISGILHGCAAHAQISRTNKPLSGPFLFFALQGLGVVVQGSLIELLRQTGIKQRFSPPFQGWMNLAFVAIWEYYASPALVDDFARNIWLWHPVPFSIVRLLEGKSFRVPEYMPSVRWVDNGFWWNSGWAI